MKALIGSLVLVLLFVGLLNDQYLAVVVEYVCVFLWEYAWIVFLCAVYLLFKWIGFRALVEWVCGTSSSVSVLSIDSVESVSTHRHTTELKSNKLNRKG